MGRGWGYSGGADMARRRDTGLEFDSPSDMAAGKVTQPLESPFPNLENGQWSSPAGLAERIR